MNIQAGYWEDGFVDMNEAKQYAGLRAVNHFHNPLDVDGPTHGGYTGFFQRYHPARHPGGSAGMWAMLGYGSSAVDWAAQNDQRLVAGSNRWGFQTALDNLQLFLGSQSVLAYANHGNDPRCGLSNALRAIGQVEHLIQDNTVPDHARDLPHPGDGFEEFMRDRRNKTFKLPPDEWVTLPLQKVEQYGFRGIWDQDVYSDQPGVTWRDGATPGLDEFTSANTFAYNVSNDADLHQVLDLLSHSTAPCIFTTIPGEAKQGFTQLSDVPTNTPFLWPELGDLVTTPSEDSYWAPWGDTLPEIRSEARQYLRAGVLCQDAANRLQLPSLTYVDRDLNSTVWTQYAAPLISRSLGYSTAAIKLLLPPVRAELAARPDDPSQVELHLYNLGTGEDAVTWHLRSVHLAPIQVGPQKRAIIDLTSPNNDEVTVPTPGNRVLDVPPGGTPWVSPPFRPTADEQWMLDHASYVSVLVEATLGSGAAETPIAFGVPIPSAYVHVVQEHLFDSSTPANFDNTSCPHDLDNPWCRGAEGIAGTLREPLTQWVTGRIELLRPSYDTVGDKLEGTATADVVKARARLAGVALVVRNPNSPDLPRADLPTLSTLKLTGAPNLVPSPSSKAYWVRSSDAKDEPDPDSFTFMVGLDLTEFKQRAGSAANDLYLVSWTQAGNLWLQKLIVWLPDWGDTASALASKVNSCLADGAGARNMSVSTCSQDWSSTGPADPCKGSGWTQQGTATLTLAAPRGQFTGAAATLFNSLGAFHCTSVGGLSTSAPCNGGPCAVDTGPYVMAEFFTTATGAGACPGAGNPPSLPAVATFERAWAEDGTFIERALGLQKPSDSIQLP